MGNRLLSERALDGGVTANGKPRRSVTVNEVESPLGWLRSRGHLSLRQFEAGEQLRQDWERANLSPQVTMRWDPAPVAKGPRGPEVGLCLSEHQMAARKRFEEAVEAAGPGLADILWRVVCAGEGMREAETALGWPARAGKLVLAMALDRIADYYRLR